ncbi:MAG: DNA-3-methyladenine glycosylase [Thermoanaerobaculia bacterium]|nr:DNA-3-methyladenine glycosylase [Thermoanaerobaculia bacterium]
MTDPLSPLPRSFYDRRAEEVAPDLLGRWLVREEDSGRLVLRLVETEAYLGTQDRAAHAWNGRRTERTESLYLPPGHAYVYFVYGMHHCLNAVTGGDQEGGAVLLRAAEPVEGTEVMIRRRDLEGDPRPGDVAGGPAKLCQALAVDRELDGTVLDGRNLLLTHGHPATAGEIVRAPRIGIDYAEEAVDWPLRFAIRENRHVSRPRP